VSEVYVAISRLALLSNGEHPRNERELLGLYLSLAPEGRRLLFASTAAVAANFGISQRTLQRWITDGSILAIQVGRKYQVYLPAVEKFIANCNDEPIPENVTRHLHLSRQ
jgi:excisionase family DNA binding protein